MYKTISAADGSQLNPDYLAKDFVTDLFHYRGETVSIKYKDGQLISDELRTLQSNAEWSRCNNMYILNKDITFNDEIDDYIFKPELDHLNDKVAIEARKKEVFEMESLRKKEGEEFGRVLRMAFGSRDIGINTVQNTGTLEHAEILSLFELTQIPHFFSDHPSAGGTSDPEPESAVAATEAGTVVELVQQNP